MAMEMLLRRMKRDNLTVHGFRSTFRDWTATSTACAREVAEAALAHSLCNKVEAAYRRGDLFEKRRRLMEDWAVFCERVATAEATFTPMGSLRHPKTLSGAPPPPNPPKLSKPRPAAPDNNGGFRGNVEASLVRFPLNEGSITQDEDVPAGNTPPDVPKMDSDTDAAAEARVVAMELQAHRQMAPRLIAEMSNMPA